MGYNMQTAEQAKSVTKTFGGLTVNNQVSFKVQPGEIVGLIASFLRYPKRAQAEKHAWHILEVTGLADRAQVSAAGLTLAGRKRLEIGKALALEPSFLLLDEVVAGLNPTEVDLTIELILKLRDQGVIILIVEHIMRVIMQICDRLAVLNYGEKIAEGTPAEISNNPAVK